MRHLVPALLLLTYGAALPDAAAKRPKLATTPDGKIDVSKLTDEQRRNQAQKLVTEGRNAFDHASYEDAIERFEEAFRLFPKPKMLYNIGLTYEALNKEDRALCALERFVAESPDADPALIADSRQKIEHMKGSVGRVEVQAPEGAIVFIDGDERGPAPLPAPLCVSQGMRRVVALLPNTKPIEIDVEVKVSELLKLALDPAAGTAKRLGEPTPAKVEAPKLALPSSPPSAPAPAPRAPLYKQWWLWTAVGVVVVGGVAAGVGIGVGSAPNVMPPAAEFGPYKVFP